MTDGCYDLDGKCTVCGEYHPCSCETEQPETALEMELQGFDGGDGEWG